MAVALGLAEKEYLEVLPGRSHAYINLKDVINFQPVSTISNESRIEISKAKDTER